jgi:predicted helicase
MGDGLADHQQVTVLDFACGTGTFLLEAFQQIFENIGGAESGKSDLVVREHLTKNIFGFEYLVAPYTIAHLKLSQYLRDQRYPLHTDERLQIFLTNTLEPIEPQFDSYFPAVSREVEAAQRVKDRSILVIVGNPPYSGHSKNNGAWTARSIDGYKYTIERRPDLNSEDGRGPEERVPLGERNSKWLNDDYVKFIRFAQLKMDAVPEGLVGVITNHAWLDNPTFRGMRQSLMRSFDQIFVLDLHGSTKRKEKAPDGGKDENVFDILPGVAITIFVKKPGLERGVWRGDLWGRRLEKYLATAQGSLDSLVTKKLEPAAPGYLLSERDESLGAEYDSGWKVTEIFGTSVLGFQTHRDKFAISFTEAEMREKLAALANERLSDADLKRIYGLKSNRDWSLSDARSLVRAHPATPLSRVAYRPFDVRWAEFSGLTIDYPRRELLDHVAGRDNLCLLVSRQIGTPIWRHVFVADLPADNCLTATDTKGANHVLPMLRYTPDGETENITGSFRLYINQHYNQFYSVQEIMGYVYAILHASDYRERYAAFLRMDFPRISLPSSSEAFESLSALGWALLRAHLLKEVPSERGVTYRGRGTHQIEAPRYSAAEATIWINNQQGFAPVPPAIWEFHVGGHQVLAKYLKSRSGRALSLDEINHVCAVAESISFTLQQVARIDEAYAEAFSFDA